ncbi:prepilin peptidase CpaA [Gracilibacillus orientalis]|uniref:Prepilin peptidase CpaA n=1 Tax=Gracilibacillus orientalis TaxID=334253 RepID=A0A1I4P5P7_9BACI|nr:prepilin peptidase [Gracilibacillus orientalis]SFM22880.1 prepilin peptidase CpaA [Gracilibacillus orientalis]
MALNFYILFIYLLIGLYTDVRYSKLPNWLTVSGVLVGVLYHVATDLIGGLIFTLLGLAVSIFVLILLYLFKALSAGDVKLFAGIGAIAGMEFSLYSILYSVLVAGLISVIILIVFKLKFLKKLMYPGYYRLLTILKKEPKHTRESFMDLKIKQFPFMYAVIPGVLITLYYF